MTKAHILVVDDDNAVRSAVQMLLNQHFTKVSVLADPELIPDWLDSFIPDIVILDMNYNPGKVDGSEGIKWLEYLQKKQSGIITIMITAFGDIELAVKAVRMGAFDFIIKPWSNHKMISTIQAGLKLSRSLKKVKILETRQQELNRHWTDDREQLIGLSAPMKRIKNLIAKIAPTTADVLILGENGTGKGVVAKEMHLHSDRNKNPFIHIDLGSLPDTLFESELFGYDKGAFTGADESRPGRIELADKGTLFLDEIGNLSLQTQTKLLSVLQSRKVFRLGSTKAREVDFRLITATNRKIHQMVDDGKFRDDLLYRINTIEIEIPPLRDRDNDIPVLVGHFLNLYGNKYRKAKLMIKDKAMEQLVSHPWPGNIRELMQAIERAVILSENGEIGMNAFFFRPNPAVLPSGSNLNIENLEKQAMLTALEQTGGNVSKAAQIVGISRVSFYRHMKKYGI